MQAVCVPIEMGIVVAKAAVGIELINCEAARLAHEQFRDRPVLNGVHRGSTGGHDVNGLVRVIAPSLRELPFERFETDAFDW